MEQEPKKKFGWGGKREGAGRRPVVNGELRKARSVRATDAEWVLIRKLCKVLKDGGEKAEQLKKIIAD